MNIINVAVVGLFIIFILNKREKSHSDYTLLVFNFILIIAVLFNFEVVKNDISSLKVFIHFNTIFWLSTSVFIYSYSLLSNKNGLILKWWFFIFLLPFFLFSFWDLLLKDNITAVSLQHTLVQPDFIYHIFFKANKLFTIIISFHILKRIKQHETLLKSSFSYIEDVSLKWLRNYTWLVITTYAIHLILFLLYNFGLIPEIDIAYNVMGALSILGAYYLSYYGVKWYSISDENLYVPPQTPELISESRSSENKKIFQEVERLFKDDQIFTNPGLRIRDVAERIDIPIHRLSEAINDQFGKPFYDYVAHHRCQLLKAKLRDPKNNPYTILGLAHEAGFNSKATLNRVFKEQTGLTPSKYKEANGSR
jgi:AraC-like DNA-binding protein